jgi:uncharacterized membrane protein
VIFRNLLSLLFIVTFPFVASGFTHFKPSFMFPVIIYMANVLLIAISNFLLAHYIFKHKPALTIPGHDADKQYIFMQSKILTIVFSIAFVIILATAIVTNLDNKAIANSFYAVPILAFAGRRWMSRYKPKKVGG